MANFMWLLEWPWGAQISIVSGCLDKISIWIGEFSKVDCPLQYGWVLSSPSGAWIEQKKAGRKNLPPSPPLFMPHWLDWAETTLLIFSCPQIGIYIIDLPGYQAYRFRLELGHLLSWVSSLQTAEGKILSLHNHVSQFLTMNQSHAYNISSISLEDPD